MSHHEPFRVPEDLDDPERRAALVEYLRAKPNPWRANERLSAMAMAEALAAEYEAARAAAIAAIEALP